MTGLGYMASETGIRRAKSCAIDEGEQYGCVRAPAEPGDWQTSTVSEAFLAQND